MEINSLKRSTDRVEGGDWVSDIPEMGDLRLRVRGIGSAQYKAVYARKSRAVPRKDRERDGSIKDDVLHQIRGEALHEAILLEWGGLTSGGQEYAYDADTAMKWLTDPDFADFHYATLYAAGVVGKDRADAQEELEKNSQTPLAGK